MSNLYGLGKSGIECSSLPTYCALITKWGPAGSYGSTKRYKSFERLKQINSKTIIGAGGELSDFQYILNILEDLTTEDFCLDDDVELTPKEVFAYLNSVMYNRRTK